MRPARPEVGDATMTVTDEMLRRFERRLVVVGDNRIGESRSVVGRRNQRRALLPLGLQGALIFSNRVQDQPVDPAAGEGIDHDPLTVGIVVRACGQYCGVTPIGPGLDSSVNQS
jgi:hypothetical protein